VLVSRGGGELAGPGPVERSRTAPCDVTRLGPRIHADFHSQAGGKSKRPASHSNPSVRCGVY
jgi:hypothetical protein